MGARTAEKNHDMKTPGKKSRHAHYQPRQDKEEERKERSRGRTTAGKRTGLHKSLERIHRSMMRFRFRDYNLFKLRTNFEPPDNRVDSIELCTREAGLLVELEKRQGRRKSRNEKKRIEQKTRYIFDRTC